jgi:teichuronic acid biosynthesis glycosyltransferase TuaH
MDLIVMSLERWDGVWRRNQHLVAGLLRGRPNLRVLFVEPPADPVHQLLRRERPRWGTGLREVALPELGRAGALTGYQPTKVAPRRVDPRTDARLAAGVLRAARRLGMHQPILWVNDPAGAEVLHLTSWRALYDITDDWLLAPRTKAEHERLLCQEEVLLRDCAEVVVCSPELARTRGQHRKIRVIRNAVDVAAYRRRTRRPSDLPPGRTALYVGTLHRDRLDVDLCVSTAQRVGGDGRLVMLGPIALNAVDCQGLLDAGAVLLGPRPSSDVPAYLQHSDVLVVPHLVNDFTRSLDPLKAYEYRAAGRPVVSTPVSGFSEDRSGQVTVAGPTTFPAVVRTRLRADTPTLTALAVPDWSERVNAMGDVLDALRDGL